MFTRPSFSCRPSSLLSELRGSLRSSLLSAALVDDSTPSAAGLVPKVGVATAAVPLGSDDVVPFTSLSSWVVRYYETES